MTEKMLPILLTDINDVIPILRNTWPTREVLRVSEKVAPLGREQIDDVEVFALRLRMASLCREEMNVRITAIPTVCVHVNPAFEA